MQDDETKPLQCLIIDDELSAHKALRFHMEQVPWLSFKASCMNAVEALETLSKINPDVIFLDVNMPHISGLEFLEIAGKMHASVVLTTAFQEYAMDGYSHDVTDFLLKPVTLKQFLKTAHKILQKSTGINPSGFHPPSGPFFDQSSLEISGEPSAPGPAASSLDAVVYKQQTIWIKEDKKLIPIEHKDIVFIECKSNYVHIYNSRRFYTTRVSMNNLMEHLPENFVMTHRSYIANRHHIKEISGNELIMTSDHRIKVKSDARREIFQKLMA